MPRPPGVKESRFSRARYSPQRAVKSRPRQTLGAVGRTRTPEACGAAGTLPETTPWTPPLSERVPQPGSPGLLSAALASLEQGARVPERPRAARLRLRLLPGNKKIDPTTRRAYSRLSSTGHFLGPWSPDRHGLQMAVGGAGVAGAELFGF